MAKKEVKVSIVIVNYKTKELTWKCIQSVIDHTNDVSYEIIVVDNDSNDESVNMLQKLHKENKINLIISDTNLGFAGGNNLGIKIAKGKYVLLLNSDTEVSSDAISRMSDWMDKHDNVGIATCALHGADGVLQSPGGSFPSLAKVFSWMTIEDLPFVDKLIRPFHAKSFLTDTPVQFDWVTGTFFLIRSEVLDEIGVLDEDFFMYTEEVDYCYRARKSGWEIFYVPLWHIIHYGKASSSNEFALLHEFKGIKLFYKKHYPKWQHGLVSLFIKIGSLLRLIAFELIGKPEISKIYVKAFKTA